ncbi:DUF998 domain-containing protein [Methanobacterium formicicum]|uniref:DUF998 domain-containing protein n=1 Tax=Methanobacterium formicicum (strain DSM 3637 / PP1) TaxID=1204725 RepID=K2QE71_METFP|nr:DUF998 domain-containing protein [Methanobacterium formicicum]EKF86381.1 hypothetical protein A994_02823 [Methanobacterium formicicum DSM 3637]
MNVQNENKQETGYYKIAGIILFISALQYLLAVNLAETQFPGYSIANNTLSTLGGSIPLVEPSAIIFNVSVILFGILGLATVYLILKSGGSRIFSVCLAISSAGAIGVGLFPQYTGNTHLLFALVTFLFGSLATLFSYRLNLNIPMIIVSLVMGLMSFILVLLLIILGSGDANPFIAYLGIGGNERFVAYPIIIYLAALGGYLTSRGQDNVKTKPTE